jgi:DMSO/TMAO reductase YedYZ heme-binding membrane subunit
MIRRLGGRRWWLLHRLIYVSAVSGVAHYLWLVKADTLRPLAYGMILTTLLVFAHGTQRNSGSQAVAGMASRRISRSFQIS